MKYSQAGFRFFNHRFAVMNKNITDRLPKDFLRYEEADGVLLYGYIDHEMGFTFDVRGIVKQYDEEFVLLEKQPDELRTMVRAGTVKDEEAIILDDNCEFYETFKDYLVLLVENYERNKDLLETREMSFLDDLRDLEYVDDVQVHLFKEGLNPEICWVRLEGLGDHYLIGNLLNEPDQDFGYHKGETIGFAMQKLEDDTWIAVADMNPSRKLSRKDLEGGILLKKAIADFNENRNNDAFAELVELLRDSNVWIPCNAVLSDADQKNIEKMVEESEGDPEALKGREFTTEGQIRMIPDILINGDDYFFPVFSSAEEMGEYGDRFSKMETDFLHAINLARNNEKKVKGIVVNAFSDPFVLETELFDVVEKLKSRIVEDDQ